MAFWTRRFFRIAPLFYVLLAVALLAGPWLGAARDAIAVSHPGTHTPSARYLDHGLDNVLMHVSFLFGFSPHYHFRTALPDWSIGLEMAYYAVFPFLMLLIARLGWVRGSVLLAAVSVGAAVLLHRAGVRFQEPSLLVLKLHVFLAGMLAAQSMRVQGRTRLGLAVLASLMIVIPLDGSRRDLLVRLAMAVGFLALLHSASFPDTPRRMLRTVASKLAGRSAHFLGEMSYGLYLVHLLVLLPVCAWIATHHAAWGGKGRLGLALAITVPVSYLIAWVGHVAIEQPGIRLGRRCLSAWKKQLPAPESPLADTEQMRVDAPQARR